MRKVASISLDLDNLWAYMRAHGVEGWREYPTYLPQVVPHIIDVAEILGLRLTVFVVGRDAEIEANREPLQSLVRAGHGIGNHSYLHEPWMHQYSDDKLKAEIDKAHSAIEEATGITPTAFRGPGFSVSKSLLEELSRRGYRYDASVFPTVIGPLLRAAYFRSANLSDAEREERKKQFGNLKDGFMPIRPFLWTNVASTLLEIPVTTVPVFRIPMHLTYIHYLAQYSPTLALVYFRFALSMCQIFRVSPSLLLHPLDFIASDEMPEMKCFPGIGSNSDAKRSLTSSCLKYMQDSFDVLSLDEVADRLLESAADGTVPMRSMHS